MTFFLRTKHLAVSAASQHVVERLVGKSAVAGHALDGKVHAITSGVRRTALHERTNHVHHLLDIVSGMRNIGRALYPEATHGIEPHRFALVRDVLPRSVLTIGAIDDLVVNVGDVGNESHLDASPLEILTQNVIDERGTAMAEMRRAIHRGATQIHPQLAWFAHGERPNFTRQGVIQREHEMILRVMPRHYR